MFGLRTGTAVVTSVAVPTCMAPFGFKAGKESGAFVCNCFDPTDNDNLSQLTFEGLLS